jgi:gamma-glutamylcyclotransferase (GGCT)/AIG2-like uncharacterized protein YtfP
MSLQELHRNALTVLLRHINLGMPPGPSFDWSGIAIPDPAQREPLFVLLEAWQRGAISWQQCCVQIEPVLHYPSQRLLVYGSLAPGERHDDLLGRVPGDWQPAQVCGHIDRTGEYPSFTWQPDGPVQQVQCFSSPALPAHWPRLDAFEGDGYCRVWVTAQVAGALCVASIYHAAP